MDQMERSFSQITTFGLLGALVGVVLAVVLYLRRRRVMPVRAAVTDSVIDGVLVTLALAVLYLALRPALVDGASRVSLVPGADLVDVFRGEQTETSRVQALGNFVLLLPIGALLPVRVLALRSLWKTTAAVAGFSVLLELGQWILPVGRIVSTDDVLINTAGGLIGALLTWYWWRQRPHSDQESQTLRPRTEARF